MCIRTEDTEQLPSLVLEELSVQMGDKASSTLVGLMGMTGVLLLVRWRNLEPRAQQISAIEFGVDRVRMAKSKNCHDLWEQY